MPAFSFFFVCLSVVQRFPPNLYFQTFSKDPVQGPNYVHVMTCSFISV